MTPPSELIRPPSKAAVIFLRWTTGKQNGRRLSSVMAGVACLDPAKGWLQQPNPTPDQKLTLLPPPQNRPRHEYDGLAPPQSSANALPPPSGIVGHHRGDRHLDPASPIEKSELDDAGAGHRRAALAPYQLDGGLHRAAGGQQIID